MTALRTVWRRVTALLGRAHGDRDFDNEVQAHLDFAAAEYESRGMAPDAARRAALRDFGGVAQTREAYRDVRGFPAFEALVQDARFALRVLRRAPVFTAVAVLTLALGIGANGAIFSVAGALLSRPVRGFDARALAVVAVGQKAPAAPADYVDWKTWNTSFADLAAYRQRNVTLTGAGAAERLYATEVTANFFSTLGVAAAVGRTISAADGENGVTVAVLTHAYWQRRFAGDAGVLGRVLEVDGRPTTIVGVTPPGVEMPMPTDVWLPLALRPPDRARRDVLTLHVVGRLKPGATFDDAQAEFAAISRQLETSFPATNRGRRAHVMPLREFVQGTITRRALMLLLGCVAVVLVVACANIAGLQMARVASRERECNLRTALGANRWRIAQLALVENLLLAVAGGAAGVFVAATCVRLLLQSMPADIVRLIPGFAQIQIDWRALTFMAAVAVGSGLLAGAAPALMWSRGRLVSTTSRQRLRSGFVVGQIGIAVTMVAVGLLFVRGERELLRVHEVPAPASVVVLNVALSSARYGDHDAKARFYEAALQQLTSAAGVQSVAACTTPPLSNNGTTWTAIDVEGEPVATAAPARSVVDQRVSPDFFEITGIALAAGRRFDVSDRPGRPPVAIISEAMARQYWPAGGAIGKRVRIRNGNAAPWLEIVGVADNVLYDWTARVPEPVLYQPIAQAPMDASAFLVRVSGDAAMAAGRLTRELARVDPLLPAYGVMSLQEAIAESFAGTAQIAAMMNILAALAFVIAVIGVYGIVAYSVAARTRELGVRIALGATRQDIFRLVMRHALLLSVAGVALGLVATIATTAIARGFVFGVASSTARATVFGAAGAVALTTILAACVPARRATRTDPLDSLRVE